jgi:hypothetical protein
MSAGRFVTINIIILIHGENVMRMKIMAGQMFRMINGIAVMYSVE